MSLKQELLNLIDNITDPNPNDKRVELNLSLISVKAQIWADFHCQITIYLGEQIIRAGYIIGKDREDIFNQIKKWLAQNIDDITKVIIYEDKAGEN